MKKVILGGTFDILYKGHEALFGKTFDLGKVTIGLTSDRFAEKLKKRRVDRFLERKKFGEKSNKNCESKYEDKRFLAFFG